MFEQLERNETLLKNASSDTRHKPYSGSRRHAGEVDPDESTLTHGELVDEALPAFGRGQLPMQCMRLADEAVPQGAKGPLLQPKANRRGLPEPIVNGVQRLSGQSLRDVTVHYNSEEPNKIEARAFTRGNHIHVGRGQEGALAHEAWHVVQKRENRVPVTRREGNTPINDDERLEREADVMGARALRLGLAGAGGQVAQAPQVGQGGGSLESPRNAAAAPNETVQKIGRGRPRRRQRAAAGPAEMRNAMMSNRELMILLPRTLGPRGEGNQDIKAIRRDYYLWHQGILKEDPALRIVFLKRLERKITGLIFHPEVNLSASDNSAFGFVWKNVRKQIDLANLAYSTVGEGYRQRYQPDPEVIGDIEGDIAVGMEIDLEQNLTFEEDEEDWAHGGRQNPEIEKVYMDRGGNNVGVFKPEVDRIPLYARTRAPRAGIPEFNPNQTGRSVAAYRIDRLLGARIIPETERAKAKKNGVLKRGSVMRFVEGAVSAREYAGPEHDQELANLFLMDVITGQVDRHSGNILTKDDKVWGIDNDMAFGANVGFDEEVGQVYSHTEGERRVSPGMQPGELKIDREFAIRIINLSLNPDIVRNALSDLINPAEINRTIERLKNLATYLTGRIAANQYIMQTEDW